MTSKVCYACKKSKAISNFGVKSASKDGLAGICKPCKKIKDAEYYSANKDSVDAKNKAYKTLHRKRLNEYEREWARNNPEKRAASVAKYNKNNKEKRTEAMRKWRAENPDKAAEANKKLQQARSNRMDVFRAQNRASYRKHAAKRVAETRFRQLRCQKSIVNMKPAEVAEIEGLYLFTSIFKGFEVDHEIPLNGKRISGLHVIDNLKVIPAKANRSKGNKFSYEDAALEESRLVAYTIDNCNGGTDKWISQ